MIKDNTSRSKNAIIFMYLMITITVIFSFFEVYELNYIKKSLVGDEGINQGQNLIIIAGFMGFALVGISLTTAITFILWFRRAYFNLHQVSSVVDYGEGWAAGCWFVPIINLSRPYKIMDELFSRTAYLLNEEIEDEKNKINWWWAMFLIGNIANNIDTRIPKTLDISTLLIVKLISLGLTVYAGILAIQLIQSYHKMEGYLLNFNIEDNIEEIGAELV